MSRNTGFKMTSKVITNIIQIFYNIRSALKRSSQIESSIRPLKIF